jgi:outer membrane protein OmpA-like peptidoglycan-associated protein
MVASQPSFAIELTVEAVKAGKVTANYAKVKNGKIVYGKQATAYSPDTLDRILRAYKLKLEQDAVKELNYPRYAKVKGGDIVFGKKSAAYDPGTTHRILKAYGLILKRDKARELKDPPNYVKVIDDELVFGKRPTAYSPEEFAMLLGAYILPAVVEPAVEVPSVKEPPEPKKAEDKPSPPIEKEDDAAAPPPEPEPAYICVDKDKDNICDDQDDCPNTPKGAYVNDRGCWIIENLLFDFDKSVIKPKYYPDLDEVARVLKENPDLNVEIQGHTCWVGTKKYNQGLSERRAKSVVKYLKDKGIDPARLDWKGYGELRPAFPNDKREGRIKNRRVQIEPKR